MSDTAATTRVRRTSRQDELIRKHGFYAPTFTPEEIRRLDAEPDTRPEFKLLRVKVLRLAKLTPLKKLNDKELDALIRLVRVVAALDAMERTGVMARKVDAAIDSGMDALDELDPQDMQAGE